MSCNLAPILPVLRRGPSSIGRRMNCRPGNRNVRNREERQAGLEDATRFLRLRIPAVLVTPPRRPRVPQG